MSVNRTARWKATKKEWKKLNQPDETGHYTCGICKQPVSKDTVTLDHIVSRYLYPELEYDLTNIQPAHEICNQEKGDGGNIGGSRLIERYGKNPTLRMRWKL